MQHLNVVGMKQRLDIGWRQFEAVGIYAKDLILALVPHPVAIDPVPVPGSHLAGGDREAAALFAFQQSRVRFLQFGGTGANTIFELAIEALELARLAVEFRKHLDLGAQHLGHDGHRNIVDRTHFVAAQPVEVADLYRGDEYHRRLLEAGMFADHRGELEPVQFRHADVDQDDGDIVLQQELERFASGRGLDQVLAEFLQDDFIGEQLRRLIVNQKNVYLVLVHHLFTPIGGVTTFGWRAAAARY